MKKLLFLLIMPVLVMLACSKMNDNSSVSKTKDIVAPASFEWNLTRPITVHLTNMPSGVVRVSSEKGDELYIKALCDGVMKSQDFNILVPALATHVRINDSIVEIKSNTVNYGFPNGFKSAMITNYAMSFNGTDAWIKVAGGSALTFTNQYSISAWVKASLQQSAKIIQKGDWDGLGIGQDFWNGWQTSVAFTDGTSSVVDWGEGRPVLNRWYHLVGNYDGTTLKLYVDGTLKKSVAETRNIRSTTRLISIASDAGNQKFFQGVLDEVTIWNTSMSPEQIVTARTVGFTGSESGLKGYWKFNEEAGTTCYDMTSDHYDGANIGGVRSTEVNYALTVDTDVDGVPDSYDDYPLDNTRAFNNYIPASGYSTLAFEDLWPGQGDFDFNDLVLGYKLNTVTNAYNKIVETKAEFIVRAIGGSYMNGFGFQIPACTIPLSAITCSGYNLNEGYVSLLANGLEAQQPKPTVIVFDNAYNIIPGQGGVTGVNVEQGVSYITPDTVKIHLSFPPNTYTLNQLNLSSFNPFLIVNKTRGREIHLVDEQPTALADDSYMGTDNDDSKPASNRYYKTKNNLPWALNIPGTFDYVYEKQDILSAYLKMAAWAQSGGTQYADWYLDLPGYRNTQFIFQH